MRNTAGRGKRSVPWGCGGESGGAAFHEAEHTFGYAHASCALLRRFGAAPKVNVFMKHYTRVSNKKACAIACFWHN